MPECLERLSKLDAHAEGDDGLVQDDGDEKVPDGLVGELQPDGEPFKDGVEGERQQQQEGAEAGQLLRLSVMVLVMGWVNDMHTVALLDVHRRMMSST